MVLTKFIFKKKISNYFLKVEQLKTRAREVFGLYTTIFIKKNLDKLTQ
jgi:hypothetical protein